MIKKTKKNVKGAPYKIGDWIKVIDLADVYMSKSFIGKRGKVLYFNYNDSRGQYYPHDPKIGVRLKDGATVELWKDEVTLLNKNGSDIKTYCVKCKNNYSVNGEYVCRTCTYRYYEPYFSKTLNIDNNKDIL